MKIYIAERDNMSAVLERTENRLVKKFEIWVVDIPKAVGRVQSGIRPCVIVQNEKGNQYSPLVSVAPMTTSRTKRPMPTHVRMNAAEIGLEEDSTVLVEQTSLIDKTQLLFKVVDNIPREKKQEIMRALFIQYGFGEEL